MESAFEWDDKKNQINIEKDSIDFCDAIELFEGPCFSVEDDRVDYGELRTITIGLLEGRMVIVVHTARNNQIRIISMRKANEREKNRFWDRLDRIKDNQIDYSDIAELGEHFWKKAKLVLPETKSRISIRLDNDVLEWFKDEGKGYQTKINAVLKSYVEAQK